jgi:hypothetical protein
VASHEHNLLPFTTPLSYAPLSAESKPTDAASNKERLDVCHDMCGAVPFCVSAPFLCGAPPRRFCVAPRNLLLRVGKSGSGRPFPRGGNSSCLSCRGGAGLRAPMWRPRRRRWRGAAQFCGALRHRPPDVFRRYPGIAPGWPHVRLANAKSRW